MWIFMNYYLHFQLLGGACFSHGPYTFYKAVRIGNSRVLRLGSFFLTKLWSDADLVSIGELQLLWMDSRGPNQPLASLRLYFLPENTPDGRRDTHGEVSLLKDHPGSLNERDSHPRGQPSRAIFSPKRLKMHEFRLGGLHKVLIRTIKRQPLLNSNRQLRRAPSRFEIANLFIKHLHLGGNNKIVQVTPLVA